MQAFYIKDWTTGEDQVIELNVRFFGDVFCIRYSPETIEAPALREQHLNFLHALDGDDGSDAAIQMKRPFEPLMENLARKIQGPASYLLSDYLYPQYFVLEATASAKDTKITPRFKEWIARQYLTPPGDYMLQRLQLTSLELETWVSNVYSSSQIWLASSARME